MARKTVQNDLTSPEKLARVNKDNIRLMKEFLRYLKSINRASTTIDAYEHDLNIFWCYILENCNNKPFSKVSKRDLVSYQCWLGEENKNSPARVRRLKSSISSLSNFVENILDEDEEFAGFRSVIKKIENPANELVREKTILTEEQCDVLLVDFCNKKQYDKACLVALAMCSGRRKSELVRFKVSYFDDENIIYGSLYKTPEKIMTKGRGAGKPLTCYTLVTKFKPYFDLWMKERERLGIESQWLFPNKDDPSNYMAANTINSWMNTCSRTLETDVYCHCFRHYFVTELSRQSIPDEVITALVGWSKGSALCSVYNDRDKEEDFGEYFGELGIKKVNKKNLTDIG